MKTNALLLAALTTAAGLALPGCVITGSVHEHAYRERTYVVAPPPPAVVAPAPVVVAPAPGYVVVREAPPVLVVQPPSPHPGGDVVWVPSYYEMRGGTWVLMPGRYSRPPHRGAVWVPPHSDRVGAEVRFYAGGWR
jgi:hypothetical protein